MMDVGATEKRQEVFIIWKPKMIIFPFSGLGATLNVAKPKKGSFVAIFGFGAAAEGARIEGASRMVGVDLNAYRFKLAKKFEDTEFVTGVDRTIQVTELLVEEGGQINVVDMYGYQVALFKL
ncbi:unnamed protein product [Lactuca virosa]|uniref:alcohol dehydrogenase n=1 Tax=Lactuca virosa TaxID=75947 RepID=A0AAU9P935_9ASTR|nr:unnamed protein product [Lactuca virosa]